MPAGGVGDRPLEVPEVPATASSPTPAVPAPVTARVATSDQVARLLRSYQELAKERADLEALLVKLAPVTISSSSAAMRLTWDFDSDSIPSVFDQAVDAAGRHTPHMALGDHGHERLLRPPARIQVTGSPRAVVTQLLGES